MKSDTVSIFFSILREETNEETLSKLMPYISRARRQRAGRYLSAADRKLCLYSGVLLRDAVCGELGISNTLLNFFASETGKLYLGEHNLEVSLSHTKMAVAAALSAEKVGIDVEKLRPVDLAVAKRCFAEDERDYVLSSVDPNRAFLEIWTRKEARLKASGEGLSVSLSSFSVLKESDRFRTYEREGYLISLCCKKDARVYFNDVSEFELERPRLAPLEA